MVIDLTCDDDDDAEDPVTKLAVTQVTTQTCHKRGFPSRAAALRSIQRASWRARFYRCDVCGDWHVTNTEKQR